MKTTLCTTAIQDDGLHPNSHPRCDGHHTHETLQPLRVLMVEDSDDDAALVLEALRRSGFCPTCERVQTAREMHTALEEKDWDVILCDHSLPTFSSPAALQILGKSGKDIPLIIVSGTIGEETAVESLKQGADDYLLKQSLTRMGPAVRRALKCAEDRRQRNEIERKLRASESRYRTLVETTFDCFWELDANGRYIYASSRVFDLLGYRPEEILGACVFDLLSPEESQRVSAFFDDVNSNDSGFIVLEHTKRHKDGRSISIETRAMRLFDSAGNLCGYRGVDRDITRRRQLEEQCRQSQKMEVLGHLSGGIAHDFNNILAATMMHLGLIQANPHIDDETLSALRELEGHAKRASGLTRQLLMFSRRSALEIKPVDLNTVVSNVLRMLRRIIGENITLQFKTTDDLPCIQADVGMLEQVVLNLVVNARDAMPNGGTLTISSTVSSIDGQGAQDHPLRRPGTFVCLSVSDTGCGMDQATLKRVFEPFFTTKGPGKGTGLGLATVYKIAEQHNGWVEAESAPGVGSTFRLFLPSSNCADSEAASSQVPQPLALGSETILLVEDDDAVRRLVKLTLCRYGYRVLDAKNGLEAVDLWQLHWKKINLLLTDLVLPGGLSGRELANLLLENQPRLKVIISSGYSADLPDSSGAADEIRFLSKPYEPRQLAKAIRECLDEKNVTTQQRKDY